MKARDQQFRHARPPPRTKLAHSGRVLPERPTAHTPQALHGDVHLPGALSDLSGSGLRVDEYQRGSTCPCRRDLMPTPPATDASHCRGPQLGQLLGSCVKDLRHAHRTERPRSGSWGTHHPLDLKTTSAKAAWQMGLLQDDPACASARTDSMESFGPSRPFPLTPQAVRFGGLRSSRERNPPCRGGLPCPAVHTPILEATWAPQPVSTTAIGCNPQA